MYIWRCITFTRMLSEGSWNSADKHTGHLGVTQTATGVRVVWSAALRYSYSTHQIIRYSYINCDVAFNTALIKYLWWAGRLLSPGLETGSHAISQLLVVNEEGRKPKLSSRLNQGKRSRLPDGVKSEYSSSNNCMRNNEAAYMLLIIPMLIECGEIIADLIIISWGLSSPDADCSEVFIMHKEGWIASRG